MEKEPWHKQPMGLDEKAGDFVKKFADDEADRTAPVATMSFDDAKKALGEDEVKHELDEQPTRKMGALSADEAERVAAATGKRRVFKHPSKPPPPRLELPLATAQFQAIVEEELPLATPPRSRARLVVVALTLAFVIGSAVAWATHRRTAPTSSPAIVPTASPPFGMNAAPELEPEPELTEPEVDAAEVDAAEVDAAEDDAAEDDAPLDEAERAAALLAEAESLRGTERRSALEQAAQADPSNPHAASALAEFHMEVDPEEALEWALQASQLRRRRARYRELVADAYERTGNLRAAARARAAAAVLRAED